MSHHDVYSSSFSLFKGLPHCQQKRARASWGDAPHAPQTCSDRRDEDLDIFWAVSCIKASARDPSCTGMIATPTIIERHTTSLPSAVTGAISPKPTVVRVVSPKYMAAKKFWMSGFTPLSVT
mmetsp:Transcript_3575/g.8458  ORF Transcript_3575/g.8458 Transcript_3575/m.8458 type:complete len:122 (+) Transcript_3575:103-468(+)